MRILAFVLLALMVLAASTGTVWRALYPLPYSPIVRSAAHRYGVNPLLVAAVVQAESKGRADAMSARGAIGLMQVMPATGAWAAAHMGLPALKPGQLRRPTTNVAIGTWYLGGLIRRYHGNVSLALAAYNGGEQNVDRWLRQGAWSGLAGTDDRIPFVQTRDFVRGVLATYALYRRLYR